MGAAESRNDNTNVFETPQYLRYSQLFGDPRSPSDGRTPLCSETNQLHDPRSPSAMFDRTPIFDIPEPFDFDKFAGLEPISPNVGKFDNKAFDETPTTSFLARDIESKIEEDTKAHIEADEENNEGMNGAEGRVSKKSVANSLQDKSKSSNRSSKRASCKKNKLCSEQKKDGDKKPGYRRRSFRLYQENRVVTTKKLEFTHQYSSPTNRSPLATRNFVRLEESPSMASYTKKKAEKQVTVPSKFREKVLFNENASSDKENLLPFRRLSYV